MIHYSSILRTRKLITFDNVSLLAAVQELEGLLTERGVVLHYNIPDDLPNVTAEFDDYPYHRIFELLAEQAGCYFMSQIANDANGVSHVYICFMKRLHQRPKPHRWQIGENFTL